MSGNGFGHRVCAGWVRWYTRRLSAEVARARRDELRSDLWEHAVDAALTGQGRVAHQVEVLGRMLAGAPSDLSWRRQAKRSAQLRPAVLAGPDQTNHMEEAMSKRWICRIIGHNDGVYPYPGSGAGGSFYKRCHRCHREREFKPRSSIGPDWGAGL